jgi:hypothetical protein
VYNFYEGGGRIAGGPVHTAFVYRVGMAGGPVQEEKGRPGGPVQNISDVGGRGGGSVLSACSGRDLLESLKHHYAQETISLSTILCFTRRRFYFFGVE